ncbi:MAG TPA: VCBS repeat-containing protein [Pirellulales bacterium]|nr:VCBS repeat-containing protein [Pirellulales bacterium]
MKRNAAGVSRFPAYVLITASFSTAISMTHAAELTFRHEEIGTGLGVGYAVSVVDMNRDQRPDIVVVDTARVIWYENPTWKLHTVLEGQTKKDNVCIAPFDIDGDGQLDFALGADWRPFDTKTGGTVQWLAATGKNGEHYELFPIAEEPMMHRMRWADLDGDGRPELIAVPLMGRDTKGPDWGEHGVRILAYRIPADPRRDPWPVEVISDELHVTHNFFPVDMNGDGRPEILVASYEGVTQLSRGADGRWSGKQLGTGNQDAVTTGNSDPRASPRSRGASEIKLGHVANSPYIATIEPWHGFQVVAYTPPKSDDTVGKAAAADSLWKRHLLDAELKWGHAVWCADLDGDADEELVIGVRDELNDKARCGVRVYDPVDAENGRWHKQVFDPGGVAVEDLAVADFNGDGRRDIVAVGRQTHNVRIYWNETPAPK